MNDIDFSECKLINEFLCFLTYDEFCQHRKLITKSYEQLSPNGKLFYKFYIYANIHMNLHFKDVIWNYINLPTKENEYILLELLKIYKPCYIR